MAIGSGIAIGNRNHQAAVVDSAFQQVAALPDREGSIEATALLAEEAATGKVHRRGELASEEIIASAGFKMHDSSRVASASLIKDPLERPTHPYVTDTYSTAGEIVNSGSNVTDIQLIARHDRGSVLIKLSSDRHADTGGTIQLQRRIEHRERGIARDREGVDSERRLESGVIQQQ